MSNRNLHLIPEGDAALKVLTAALPAYSANGIINQALIEFAKQYSPESQGARKSAERPDRLAAQDEAASVAWSEKLGVSLGWFKSGADNSDTRRE
jgi:hypothetical protein